MKPRASWILCTRRRCGASLLVLSATLLGACLGNHGSGSVASGTPPPPVVNTMMVTVDSGPTGATGQLNHAYVTVKICVPGSTTACANIDHVLLDTGSWGLRLVRSVLVAGGVTLSAQTDSTGNAIKECMAFGGGVTFGPVALADVAFAGEVAAKVPVQIMDDSAPLPSVCPGADLNVVTPGFNANGVLGVGVMAQDCGPACVSASPPMPVYYGCTAAGACSAENVALASQVTNPVAMFASDNNGIIVKMPNLINANGDASVQGVLTFGIGTQADNALPAGLTVLGADSTGDFKATYSSATFNSGATPLPALFDSGTDDYAFNDPNLNDVCSLTSNPPSSAMWLGYYCPVPAPETVSVMNLGVGANSGTSTVTLAIADPNTFVAASAAVSGLGGGRGATNFIYGMPFFYGKTVYIGITDRMAGTSTGPFYAY